MMIPGVDGDTKKGGLTAALNVIFKKNLM